MRHRSLLFFVLLALLLGLISFQEVNAAAYYEGKTITIIVGYGPGGGYDRLARILAKHLPKYIPGKPTILVQNMPGADSMIATNHLYNVAKPDGLTLGTFNRGLFFGQLLKAEGVKFDMMKFAWVGSASVEAAVLAIRTDLPYKTFDEALKAKSPIILGSTGPADSNGQFPIFLKEYLGLNAKMINYPSSADVMLAIERKEVDGRGASYSSIKPFIQRGLVRAIIRGRTAEPGIENLPVDENLTKDPKAKTIMAMRSAPDQIGRPYVAPPNTPADVMKTLREAFAKVQNDAELKQDAEKTMMDVEYVPADKTLDVLKGLFSQPPDMIKEFGKFIKF